MMNDKISVIVPIYKAEKTLERCIESIINQSYKNIEIILVNDGSPDNSSDICRAYLNKDNRIVFLEQINKGVASARNKGIEVANGKYIVFVDSDDYVDEGYIETLYKSIVEYDADLVLSGYRKVFIKSHKKQLEYSMSNKLMYIEDFLKDIFVYLDKMLIQTPWSKMFRKDIIDKNNIIFKEDINFGEDTFFIYNYLKYTNKVYNIENTNYNYVFENNNTLSTNPTGDKIEIFLSLYEKLEDIIKMYDVYDGEVIEKLNHKICNTLIYLNYDIYHLSKIDRLEKIKNAINNPKIRSAFKNSHNLNIQGKFIKILVMIKNHIAIDMYFNIKRLIKSKNFN